MTAVTEPRALQIHNIRTYVHTYSHMITISPRPRARQPIQLKDAAQGPSWTLRRFTFEVRKYIRTLPHSPNNVRATCVQVHAGTALPSHNRWVGAFWADPHISIMERARDSRLHPVILLAHVVLRWSLWHGLVVTAGDAARGHGWDCDSRSSRLSPACRASGKV